MLQRMLTLLQVALACFCVLAVSPPALAEHPVGSEFQVNSYTTGFQSLPDVAVDEDGDFVVVWQSDEQDGSGDGVFGQRFDARGNPLGGEFQINSYTTSDQSRPAVAARADGEFAVVWSMRDGSGHGVFGQRYDAQGKPLGGEFQANSYTTLYQSHPRVAADVDGNFVIVWRSAQQDSSGYGVFGQRYGSAGNPLGGEFQVNTYTTDDQQSMSVASDADGDFVVVWYSPGDGSSYGIFGQRYDALGNPLGGEFQINSYTTGPQGGPEVASDPDGDLVVVWKSYHDGSSYGVLGQRYDAAGNPLGDEFLINTYTTGHQYNASVTVDADGDFVVTWESIGQDGSATGVFGQRFDSGGSPMGSEFPINSYTTSSQYWPRVASDANGGIVVAWASLNQDGSLTGIFGQRYAPPGLQLSISGSCGGPVTVAILHAMPDSEVGIVRAANNNGFIKGGTLCNGATFEIGEPFVLPPVWIQIDATGTGSTTTNLPANRCWVQGIDLSGCGLTNAVQVP